MKLLEGKVVIITGASRGIGKGIAEVFAKHGANVAFTYSSSVESALALENQLNALGIKAKGYQSNAADFLKKRSRPKPCLQLQDPQTSDIKNCIQAALSAAPHFES